MTVLSADLVKRKKEHVFVEGYSVDSATELAGAIDASSEVMHVYGDDNAIKDVTINTGTLTLTVYDKRSNNVLFDALQKIDPNDTAEKKYNWNNIYSTSVWANRFNDENSQYTRSIFYGKWLPIPAAPSGDTNAKGTRTFSGNSDVPIEYTQPIIGEKLALTTGANGTASTATLSYVPQLTDPSASTALYAIRVVVINETRTVGNSTITNIDQEDVTITASMVNSAGTVTIDLTGLDSNTWGNYVYVNYLYDKSRGVHPTVANVGMYKYVALA